MRALAVCPDDFLFRLLGNADLASPALLHVVGSSSQRAAIARRGGDVIAGDLEDPAVYRRAFRHGDEAVIVAAPADRAERILDAIRHEVPAAPILVVADDNQAHRPGAGTVVTLPVTAFTDRVLLPELERAVLRARVERVREHFLAAERVLILMQDDPDPDAIASALALRVVLGRTKASAPLATFGKVTRPENLAMIRILEIDIENIDAGDLAGYDRIAMVDVQPSFFEETLPPVDLVIDHHPEETPVRAAMKDLRPAYGATSTILTEYLRAAETKITQRLATALLYGIKSDTLHLERGGTRADMEAFAFLHLLANHSALRRMERPQLPEQALDVLARALQRRQLIHGVLFLHLGRIAHVDLIPQFADLLLQVEGAEWSVVSGLVGAEIHISVRNVGYVRSAGEVVRAAFAELGNAGGHRAMAKAVIRAKDWRGSGKGEVLQRTIAERFLRALDG